jgi:hypothetical protein
MSFSDEIAQTRCIASRLCSIKDWGASATARLHRVVTKKMTLLFFVPLAGFTIHASQFNTFAPCAFITITTDKTLYAQQTHLQLQIETQSKSRYFGRRKRNAR